MTLIGTGKHRLACTSTPSLSLKTELQIPTAIASRVKKHCNILSAAKSLSTSSGNAEEDRSDTMLYSPMATHMDPLHGKPQAWQRAHAHWRYSPSFLSLVRHKFGTSHRRELQMVRVSKGSRVRALVSRTGQDGVGGKTKGTRKPTASAQQ